MAKAKETTVAVAPVVGPRYHVTRQMNDLTLNPKWPDGAWDLVARVEELEDAKALMVQQREHWKRFGHKFAVVDTLKKTIVKGSDK